ncbi:hypothetical protein thalar_02543 [Litoreibacter arenae DSM 19593]|uniref:Uncharacterized protein n=1 Tax=Litoreibacter arenae DSM 19593 TaxID=1123360 RepID=S9Q610_9RHOB|nr:hypothetical protein thalar_02543 [Litoreibacter arenae DSM 19593]
MVPMTAQYAIFLYRSINFSDGLGSRGDSYVSISAEAKSSRAVT